MRLGRIGAFIMTILLKFEGGKVLEPLFTIFKQDSSEEEFWSFANEDIKCELKDEVLVIDSPANQKHEDIFSLLLTLFRYYLVNTGLGKAFGSRFVMRLSERWNPEPDLLVILKNKLENLEGGRLQGPADLVIEILSDSTRKTDLEEKIPHFLSEGVQEIWIIDPANESIVVEWVDGEISYYDPMSTDVIASRVPRSLHIRVEWIWARDLHPTKEDLQDLLG
jgi:Uma2 family endonuclease